MKHFDNNADNNANNETYDGKITDKISYIRVILCRFVDNSNYR